VPYRIDLQRAGPDALDRLIELGALDAEISDDGRAAAILPDSVAPARAARLFDRDGVSISPAVPRDDGSVWILHPRAIRIGGIEIVPDGGPAEPGALRLVDAPAFGTGLHPTTALCIEALGELVAHGAPAEMLDIGTGSGILALAALVRGVTRAVGLDLDAQALRAAARNARVNGLDRRLRLVRGGPEALTGAWPLVVANVLAAPLMEMASTIAARLGHSGVLVLSGIPSGVEPDVTRAYQRCGLRPVSARAHGSWTALVLATSW
jgi:ribosomal protein L11 methyltransferase